MGALSTEHAVLNDLQDIDYNSYELGAICLRLRTDLAFRRQTSGASVYYVIEDPVRSNFHRVGLAEYTFLSMLDGNTSIAAAVAETATRTGGEAFTETQAAALSSWLVDSGLASTDQSTTAARLNLAAIEVQQRKVTERLNPLMLKVTLGNPKHVLSFCEPFVSWFFGIVGFCVWLIAVVLGGYLVSTHWSQLSSVRTVLSTDNWIWLAITWVLLKFIHEMAHGVACRRLGGQCSEAGLMFLLFVPLPYINVTTSWRFGSRWKRIIVAGAGMYAEVFLAAIAMLVWTETESEIIRHHTVNLMVTAGISTLLFNCNPLMKFDGYYILCDLIQAPNLAIHGQQDFHYCVKRLFLGVTGPAPEWPEGHWLLIRLYGIAAFAWRILICVSLIFAASQIFHGAGIVLAAAAVLLWVAVPAWKFAKYLIAGDRVNPPKRMRLAGLIVALTMAGLLVWHKVPYVERLRLPAIVAYLPVTTIRAATSGFVTDVAVRTGEEVDKGDLLVQLHNPELAARIVQLELAIEQSKLNANGFYRAGKLAAWQVELQNEIALNSRLHELLIQKRKLSVRATQSGRVLSRNIRSLQDRWLSVGTEILDLGNDDERTIRFVVSQDHVDTCIAQTSEAVKVGVWGVEGDLYDGTLTDIEPRGTTHLHFPALAAAAGGPLAVRPSIPPSNQPASKTMLPDAANDRDWELMTPHFTGSVRIPQEHLQTLGIGQRGYVEIMHTERTIGQQVKMTVAGLLDRYRSGPR